LFEGNTSNIVPFEKRKLKRLMIGFDLEKIYKPWEDIYRYRENNG
jgi:hypothetical protein